MSNGTQPPAGWYPDPRDAGGMRWWDGTAWTTTTRPGPSAASAPAPAPVHPPVAPPVIATTPMPPAVAPAVPMPSTAPPAAGPGALQQYAHPVTYGSAPTGVWRSPVDNRPGVTGMGSAIKAVLSKYAIFDGRAGRAEYWYWTLFNAILVAGVLFVLVLGSVARPLTLVGGSLYFALIAWFVAMYIPSLALTVRRLRDAGYHWALIFLALVPFGGIALLVMVCQRSKYP